MARPAPTELEVIRSTPISEHMLRITLGGDGLAAFPPDQESAYIKLVFPQAGVGRPLMRTYTIRHHREREIDVDFFLHEKTGLASAWAATARRGDRILVAGPGAKKLINHSADWFLLVGDMAALPAISVNLSALPAHARGHVIIEVPGPGDVQRLEHPSGMQVHWVFTPCPDPTGGVLCSRVRDLPWLAGTPAVWGACEFSSMQTLRRFFRQDCDIPRTQMYLSSYWKIGQSEDEHKVTKRQDRVESEERSTPSADAVAVQARH